MLDLRQPGKIEPKQVRCPGERPTCTRCISTNTSFCYSSRKQLGRPKARKDHHKSSRRRHCNPFAGARPRSRSFNTCACLSEQYLLLEQLRLKTQLVVPDDLHMLRGTIQKAIDVLNC
ncbi:unnamed protein product [Penicillium camemberti]|uniref:Str. FM013 n=1 Tax=Penicillium camemberti (strain FM 013) TaxID=1429867 RepID=A0A0G4PD81_PENC3|nr:unnamed protein product [Penicillium camemberti]